MGAEVHYVNNYLSIGKIMSAAETREKILGIARSMVQSRGYNALSFREIAKDVGVKSASVHYHFPTKGDLGAALAQRYTDDGVNYLAGVMDTEPDLAACLQKYTDIFRGALLNNNRMCLCGIMAAEYDDLPDVVRVEVDRFTDANVAWLAALCARANPLLDAVQAGERALAIYAAVEGAQLVARGRCDVATFDKLIKVYRATGLLP